MTALRRTVAYLSVLACVVGLATTAATPAAAQAEPETVWLCRPGLADNPCEPDLTTTQYDSSGQVLGVDPVAPATDPKIDCFYVYPTTSDQPTPQANLDIDPELRSIAFYQAARYSSECRVFAPVYRQITLRAIGAAGSVTPEMRETAYQDVRRAWLDYLENDNGGRGVVFIGHSQGSGVLRRLLAEEVDPNDAVRNQLVSALLLGSNVTVAKGSDVGGDFQNIPACRSDQQLGCVVAFETFNTPVPPDSRFGRTDDPNLDVLCVNPASLTGHSGLIDPIYPTEPFAPGTIAAVIEILGQPPITASTPWVENLGAYSAECSSADDANVLQITAQGVSPTLNPSPDATWGLHLVDANIALGNLIDLVHTQSERWSGMPVGGVATGGGGTAPDPSGARPWAPLAVMLAGGALVVGGLRMRCLRRI